ncbi:chaplin [Allostreptomyces psammosilenae]|uniref:LPXTG-motif cell wall-anchored protein n=1 Tax=Allostreptomyces psammosilenae TaxID=1892865 RepID=A0A852ZT22_9ACTN|nr:chaplin [Allostreptomyces psammosilenae]NYI03954.1 LPXTG-motif cell wall-anchored protein [Allostreptomyces psammosilenae]
MLVVATGGVLAPTAGAAYAAEADGAAVDSPGVASGNSIQVPIDIPINICGNTVNVIGVLNPTVGNVCANTSVDGEDDAEQGPGPDGGPGSDVVDGDGAAGAEASSVAAGSPGVLSGNSVQIPVHVPLNVCGNSVDVVGVLNPTTGNECDNVAVEEPERTTPGDDGDTGPEDGGDDCDKECGPAPEGDKPDDDEVDGAGDSPDQEKDDDEVAAAGPAEVAPAADERAVAAAPGVLAETGAGTDMAVAAGLGAALIAGGGLLYRRRAGARG